jgi:hypothetical protein
MGAIRRVIPSAYIGKSSMFKKMVVTSPSSAKDKLQYRKGMLKTDSTKPNISAFFLIHIML